MNTENTKREVNHLVFISLILGATMLVSALIILVLAVLVWKFANQSPNVVLLHAWLARIGIFFGLSVGVAGVCFGVGARRVAKEYSIYPFVSLAVLLISFLAVGMWVIASIALLNTTESLLIIHGR